MHVMQYMFILINHVTNESARRYTLLSVYFVLILFNISYIYNFVYMKYPLHSKFKIFKFKMFKVSSKEQINLWDLVCKSLDQRLITDAFVLSLCQVIIN